MGTANKLAARIEALEKSSGPARIVPRINLTVLAEPREHPLLGYRVRVGTTEEVLMRLRGESDYELHARARAALEGSVALLMELRGA